MGGGSGGIGGLNPIELVAGPMAWATHLAVNAASAAKSYFPGGSSSSDTPPDTQAVTTASYASPQSPSGTRTSAVLAAWQKRQLAEASMGGPQTGGMGTFGGANTGKTLLGT